MPLGSADGNSVVVDYKGAVLAEANTGETFTAFADINLDALRHHRRKPGMINFLARQRLEPFARRVRRHRRAPGQRLDRRTAR